MDTIKSFTTCAGEAIQRCEAGMLCRSLAVVYVPVTLCRSEVCKCCQRNCVKCVHTEDVGRESSDATKEKEHLPSFSSNEIPSVCNKRVDHVGMIRDSTGCPFCPEDGGAYVQKTEANNNALCGLTLCNGGHLVGLAGTHSLVWCPKVLPACCAHCGSLQFGADEKRDTRETGKEEEDRLSRAKNVKGHRRLSSDSGRITWSESGGSGYSDYSFALISPEFSRRNDANTGPVEPEQRQHKLDSNPDCMKRPRPEARPRHSTWALPLPPTIGTTHPRNSDVTSAVANDDNEDNYVAETRGHEYTPQRERRLVRRERIQSSSDTPTRSTSEWALRRVGIAASKPVGITLDCLQENSIQDLSKDNIPRRPRSRSLFITSNPADMRLFTPMTRSSRHRAPTQSQVSKVDFSKWTKVLDAWEIGGDSPGRESIKCYGVTAVPRLNGFALTVANKVRIKIYGIDGDMKISFGTPTWPRYGRGITLTQDGKHIAVCHLTEVCIYTLDGVSVDRFKLEQFTACWGITCDTRGNFVITDPKSSCVFIISPSGDITRRIGDSPRVVACQKQSKSRCSNSWKKSKSDKSLASKKLKSPTRKNREKTDSVRRLSNVSLPIVTGRKTSGDSDDGKKQVRLLTPRYVAVNSKNQILVTDTRQRCLLVFEEDGTLLFSIGGGRMGCEKCNSTQAEDNGMPQIVPTTERWSVSSNDSVEKEEIAKKDGGLISKQPAKSNSASLLSEIYLPKRGCISNKNDRVKVIGVMHRGQVGKNESVASEPYHAISLLPMPATDLQSSSTFSPSKSVGSRLCAYAAPTPEQCVSHQETFESAFQVRRRDNSKSKLKQIAKSLIKPLWFRRKKRKTMKNLAASQVGKCESLATLSVFEDTSEVQMRGGFSRQEDNLSLSSTTTAVKSYFTTDTKTTIFTCGSVKGRSEPASPEDGCTDFSQPYCFQLAEQSDDTSDGEVCYDSSPEPVREAESEEDEDRAACRRCHVEDPRGVCVDKNDNILLVDRARHRVTVFTPNGHFLHHLLTESDGLNEPMTLCILHDGILIVTDSSASVKVIQFAQQNF